MYILKSTSSNFSTKTSLRLYLIYYDLRYRFFWDHRLYLFEFKFVVLSPRDNDIIADGLIYIIANRCFHWSQRFCLSALQLPWQNDQIIIQDLVPTDSTYLLRTSFCSPALLEGHPILWPPLFVFGPGQ